MILKYRLKIDPMGSGFYRQFTGFCHIEGKRDSFDYVHMKIMKFLIKISKMNLFRFIITDTNDNAPIFPNENINLEISESAQIGAVWRLESATDKDPDNGIKWYAIDDESMFELKEEMNSDGSKIPKIRLLHELDSDKKGGSNYMVSRF